MSDLMKLGVLRMPVTPDSDYLTLKQYIDRGRQAADLIEQQQARISELEQREADANRKALKHEQIDFGNREYIEMQRQAFGELLQERDELAATVDRLRVFANAVVEHVPDTSENHWIYPAVQTLKCCLKTTPRQNLAEHDAEVVVRAVNKCKLIVMDGPDIYSDALIEYANQLKRGEL